MMRHFALLGVVGVCLVPDGAPALGGYGPWYGPPGYPVPQCVPHFVLIPPCLPPLDVIPAPVAPAYPAPEVTPAAPRAQPRVVPEPPAQPKAAGPSEGLPRLPTTGVPVRPAPPPVIPPGGTPMTPSAFVTPPSELLAKPRPVGPTVAPPISPVILPTAATVPAVPATDAVKLPPLVPRVPGGGGKGGPPALRIELPGEPRTVHSSPLTDRQPTDVAVVPVAAAVGETPGASRTVNVFNHADRAVKLTIAGQDVTLPSRTFVKATVPASFVWSLDGGDPRTTDIPAASPGVEIVIRR